MKYMISYLLSNPRSMKVGFNYVSFSIYLLAIDKLLETKVNKIIPSITQLLSISGLITMKPCHAYSKMTDVRRNKIAFFSLFFVNKKLQSVTGV